MNAVIYDISKTNSLEPVLLSQPKALCEIFKINCIEYIFDIISKAGIKKAYAYLEESSSECEAVFGCKAKDIDLVWNFGGANADGPMPDESGTVLFCGMNFYDTNLSDAIEYHNSNNTDLTVLTAESGKYTVSADSDAAVRPYAPSGIYILSARCCDFLKKSRKMAIDSDIIEKMHSQGMKISFFDDAVYMNPLTDISDYLRCHMDILSEKARFSSAFHRILSDSSPEIIKNEDVSLEQPCCIGKNVTIGKGASVSHCVIGDNVFIGEGAVVNSSVILDGAHIAANTRCEGAVICKGASLLSGSTVCKGAAVGAGAIIGKGARVEENIRIFPKKHLDDYKTANFDIRYREIVLEFDDDASIGGETGIELSPLTAVKIGKSLARSGAKLVIGHSGTPSAQAIEMALSSGTLGGGADVWSLGECLISEIIYAAKLINADYSFFVQSDSYTKISVFSKNCTELSSDEQLRAESSMKYDCAPKMSAAHFGIWHDFSKIKELYVESLAAKKPKFPVTLSTSNKRSAQIVNELKIDSLGAKTTFRISGDGTKASAFSAQTGFVSYEKLAMICIEKMLDEGKTPKLPSEFPKSARLIFESKGVSANNSTDSCDSIFNDGFELIFNVCEFLNQRGITLEQAVASLPSFAVAQRIVALGIPLSSAFAQLDDFCSKHPDICIKPSKSGKTLAVRAECTEYETANELCDICQRIAQGHYENRDNSSL